MGLVYMNNDLHRQQLGRGTTGSDYDLSLVQPGFGRDIHFKTDNVGAFAENLLRLNKQGTVSPGIRIGNGQSNMSGVISYHTVNELPTTITHRFALSGISSQYSLNTDNTVYGGFSQAYGPVLSKDIVPASPYEQIDKNISDASGYNMDAGVRGKLFNHLQYDVSLFQRQYTKRMGTLVLQDSRGDSNTYKTNIGNSRTNGIEAFLQYKFPVTANL